MYDCDCNLQMYNMYEKPSHPSRVLEHQRPDPVLKCQLTDTASFHCTQGNTYTGVNPCTAPNNDCTQYESTCRAKLLNTQSHSLSIPLSGREISDHKALSFTTMHKFHSALDEHTHHLCHPVPQSCPLTCFGADGVQSYFVGNSRRIGSDPLNTTPQTDQGISQFICDLDESSKFISATSGPTTNNNLYSQDVKHIISSHPGEAHMGQHPHTKFLSDSDDEESGLFKLHQVQSTHSTATSHDLGQHPSYQLFSGLDDYKCSTEDHNFSTYANCTAHLNNPDIAIDDNSGTNRSRNNGNRLLNNSRGKFGVPDNQDNLQHTSVLLNSSPICACASFDICRPIRPRNSITCADSHLRSSALRLSKATSAPGKVCLDSLLLSQACPTNSTSAADFVMPMYLLIYRYLHNSLTFALAYNELLYLCAVHWSTICSFLFQLLVLHCHLLQWVVVTGITKHLIQCLTLARLLHDTHTVVGGYFTHPRPLHQAFGANYHSAILLPLDQEVNHIPYNSPIQLYDIMRATDSQYNYIAPRIPVLSGLNIDRWKFYLQDYPNELLVHFLEFGFPLGLSYNVPLQSRPYNHPTATQYKADIHHYLTTETRHSAIWGPFPTPPLPDFHTSPMLTRDKPGSNHRRVIVDLSWPENFSVNTSLNSTIHCASSCSLTYPTIDNIVQELVWADQTGRAFMFKVDLERAYRNLRIDPNDYARLGLFWEDVYYLDTSVPFGVKPGAFFCQQVTDAIRYIMHQHGFSMLNYSDDQIIVCPDWDTACQAYIFLLAILRDLGLPVSASKLQTPTRCMTCLGIEFDMNAQQIRIPKEKILEIHSLCVQWASKHMATKKQLQSLLGKLFHISKCVAPTRLFLNRMLQVLKQAPDSGHVSLPDDFYLDLNWFITSLQTFNGVVLFPQVHQPTRELLVDSSLFAFGGVKGLQAYFLTLSHPLTTEHINFLELLNIYVAIHYWAHDLAEQVVLVRSDNMVAVHTLAYHRASVPNLMKVARNIWHLTTRYNITLQVKHIEGASNTLADALSRIQTPTHLQRLKSANPSLQIVELSPSWCDLRTDI